VTSLRVTTDSIQILIVEDHQMVADGLAALLSSQPEMMIVGSARSVAEAELCAHKLRAQHISPYVVVVDFHLTDGSGADAAKLVRRICPDARIVFLTHDDSEPALFAALEAGASAFIHKSKAAAEVISTIRHVALGRKVITPFELSALPRRRRGMANPEKLTKREKEMLRLMSRGISNREIAHRLGISYTTVRSHIRSASGKLSVHSKIEAVVRARQMALID
jgi:DNA-binding NarL/FixJ family response regulator